MNDASQEFSGHPVAEILRAASDDAMRLTDTPLWSLADDDVAELMSQAARLETQAVELRLRLVAEAHARGLAARAAVPSTQGWLRGVLNVSPAAAKGQLMLATALQRLEPTRWALAERRITPQHARVIADAVADLPDASLAGRAEADLVEASERFTPAEVARLSRRIGELVARDAADAREADRLAEAERRAYRRRELRFTPDLHGTVHVRGRLDTESAAIVRRALDPLAKPRPADAGTPDLRSAGMRTADAWVEVCRRALVSGGLPSQKGERPQLVVTIDAGSLREQTGSGVLDGGERLCPGAVRRIACEAQVVPAVLGSESQPLDLGRAVRLFSPAQRRALALRDKGCAFTACDRPPAWAEAHHIRHWIDGGASDLNNAVLLCGFTIG